MAEVFELPNGKIEMISTLDDFEMLIREHLGFQAGNYFHEFLEKTITNSDDSVKAMKDKIGRLEWDLEYLQEQYDELQNEYESYKAEYYKCSTV